MIASGLKKLPICAYEFPERLRSLSGDFLDDTVGTRENTVLIINGDFNEMLDREFWNSIVSQMLAIFIERGGAIDDLAIDDLADSRLTRFSSISNSVRGFCCCPTLPSMTAFAAYTQFASDFIGIDSRRAASETPTC